MKMDKLITMIRENIEIYSLNRMKMDKLSTMVGEHFEIYSFKC